MKKKLFFLNVAPDLKNIYVIQFDELINQEFKLIQITYKTSVNRLNQSNKMQQNADIYLLTYNK